MPQSKTKVIVQSDEEDLELRVTNCIDDDDEEVEEIQN